MSPSPSFPRVAILGAGITGLTAAWKLQRAGFAPVVFEKSTRVGGAVGAMRSDGWLHELGPNSMLEGSAAVASLVDEVGLGPRRLYASPAARRRYIVRRGRPVALPASPLGFATTRLFSWPAKLGLLGEPWRPRGGAAADESVADFVRRRLGREFLDYAVNPLVGGVYAGDPERLSVRQAFPKLFALEQEYGSLLRAALKLRNGSGGPRGRMFSFPNGVGEIPAAISQRLDGALRLDHRVLAVRRQLGEWHVDYEAAGLRGSEKFAAVICALPAGALAAVDFEGVIDAWQLGVLREVEHPPVCSVFIGYHRADVQHPLDGFGLLVPQVEPGRILGALFSSTLFPGRAPDDGVGLTSFVGGMRSPELAGRPDSELVDIAHGDLARWLGARGAPIFAHVQRWPRSIPQYTLDYQRFRDAIAAAEASTRGLFIGGNCRDGISLANCIESGCRLAQSTVACLREQAADLVSR